MILCILSLLQTRGTFKHIKKLVLFKKHQVLWLEIDFGLIWSSKPRQAVADYRANAWRAKGRLLVLWLYSAPCQKFTLKPITPLIEVCALGSTWHGPILHWSQSLGLLSPRNAEDSNLFSQKNPESEKLQDVSSLFCLHHHKNTRARANTTALLYRELEATIQLLWLVQPFNSSGIPQAPLSLCSRMSPSSLFVLGLTLCTQRSRHG